MPKIDEFTYTNICRSWHRSRRYFKQKAQSFINPDYFWVVIFISNLNMLHIKPKNVSLARIMPFTK